jgi:hypothetical protein
MRNRTVITPTYAIAHAAGRDAANRQMRANRRTAWSLEDYNLACRVMANIFPASGANRDAGLAR